MIRSWMVYGALLVVSTGLSWMHFTEEKVKAEKEGVALVDETKDALQTIEYHSPDADVVYEMRGEGENRWAWVTVTDHKQKKSLKEGEPPPPVEIKLTEFKAGTAGDKMADGFAPLFAMRELVGVTDDKITSFGLNAPDTTVVVKAGGRTATLELGGETYGAKDRYIRHRESSKYYVVDDELFKPLKFANTRLPERSLFSYKTEEIDVVTLSKGGQTVKWSQHNKEDRAADWWERLPTPGTSEVGKKDETFTNWLEKAMKLKSQSYVQAADKPAELTPSFDLSFEVTGKPAQTVHVYTAEDDWYADGDYTHGLVKLTKSVVQDAAEEVTDILEGREPPPKEKKAPPKLEPDESGDADGPPGGPARLMPPGGPPGRPPLPIPGMTPKPQ
jgi:hypothetical protein